MGYHNNIPEDMHTKVHEQRLVLSGHIGFGCQSGLNGILGCDKIGIRAGRPKGVYKAFSE